MGGRGAANPSIHNYIRLVGGGGGLLFDAQSVPNVEFRGGGGVGSVGSTESCGRRVGHGFESRLPVNCTGPEFKIQNWEKIIFIWWRAELFIKIFRYMYI